MADEVTRTIVDGMGGTGTALGANFAQAIAGLKPVTTTA